MTLQRLNTVLSCGATAAAATVCTMALYGAAGLATGALATASVPMICIAMGAAGMLGLALASSKAKTQTAGSQLLASTTVGGLAASLFGAFHSQTILTLLGRSLIVATAMPGTLAVTGLASTALAAYNLAQFLKA
ncbi:MAG: hypothetical protein ACOYKZ_07465 [Chlamydiia bacterium]